MKRAKLYFLYAAMSTAILFSHAAGASPPELHLMPVPEHVVLSRGRLTIDGTLAAQLSGHSDPRLLRAVDRLLQRLQKKTGIPLLPTPDQDPKPAVMQIHCGGPGEQIQSDNEDESYRLEVTESVVRLTARSPAGILRGIETFLQLVDLDGESFFVPCVTIEDRPRFRWRGLLVDVSRHWEPPEVIRRNLDAMAAVKMNVFHWHLSDDQGFRVECKTFPKLHEMGSDGKYYTQAEVREIVAYARDRGIRVVPEFDMPGHSTAWLVGYPELASAPGPYRIERSWGVFEPCMDPTRPGTYSFLESFVGEMARLFPDPYFHIGGDEVHPKQWNSSPRIRSFKVRNGFKNNGDLQAYFNQRLQKILAGHGKRMIGWDEVLHSGLPESVVVQSWRGQASLAEGARRGHSGILSYGYYLDHMRPASFHYAMDPLGKEAANLSGKESARILGGEACMWAEFVNPDNIESRIWPRAAAIAERLWSAAERTDARDMYRRLEYLDRELEFLGLRHRANGRQMIRRMAGNQSFHPLKNFSDLLIPTALGVRLRTRKYTSFTPLNRMVDAVAPESDTARRFDELVQRLLAEGSGSNDVSRQIREMLNDWRETESRARVVIEQSFLLREIEPLSKTIAELCGTGLQALDYLESGRSAPQAWQKETAGLLDRAEKPQAEMLPAIAVSIKRLAEAVK